MRKYAIKLGAEITPPEGVIFFDQEETYAIIKWTGELALDSGWLMFEGENSNVEFSEYINLIKNGDILYFDTLEERDAYNVAESVYNGGDPLIGWYQAGEDEMGYYVDLTTNTENTSFWNRLKNWFT